MSPPLRKLKIDLPVDGPLESRIINARVHVQKILRRQDRRLLLIVGPCALQSPRSALEYAQKLATLQEEVKDSFLLVMRAYYEKARSAVGWRGLMHAPWYRTEEMDPVSCLCRTRRLLIELAKLVPLASELVDPAIAPLLCDCLSWVSIGARTVHSQPHRLVASHLPIPCGMKNSIEGSIEAACTAVLVASTPHTFLTTNAEGMLEAVFSNGNPDAHIVLRGGPLGPNYSQESIEVAERLLQKMQLRKAIIVDCSHGNSQGQLHRQIDVFKEVLGTIARGDNEIVRGLMVESFLDEHSTREVPIDSICPNKRELAEERTSCVDPCLSWSATENLIRYGHDLLQQQTFLSLTST